VQFDPWGPVVGVLFEDNSSDAVLGALQRAGISTSFNLTEQEEYSHQTRKRAYKGRVDSFYAQLDEGGKRTVTRNLAVEIAKSRQGPERLNEVLGRVGWEFKDGELKPQFGSPVVQRFSSNESTSLRQKAQVLLEKLHERSTPGGRPVDDVRQLETSLDKDEVIGAFTYLKENGLVQTFSLPFAARISARGVDAIEQGQVVSNGRGEDRNLKQGVTSIQEPSARKTMPDKVFIVHGHDRGPREAVARYLEKLGFQPIILQEQANQGRTIIEKVEANGDVGFAVVLLTPDDVGSKVGADLRPRPRQNVVVELGYFFGRLGRSRVCALSTTGTMELPTDFAGVIWEPFDEHGAWKQVLVRELKASGFEVDASKAI